MGRNCLGEILRRELEKITHLREESFKNRVSGDKGLTLFKTTEGTVSH